MAMLGCRPEGSRNDGESDSIDARRVVRRYMDFKVRRNSVLAKRLGASWVRLLERSLASLSRILPHTESSDWRIDSGTGKSRATFADEKRRSLRLSIGLSLGDLSWTVHGVLKRRSVPDGVGAIPRTIDRRERDIAECTVLELAEMMTSLRTDHSPTADALGTGFEERVVARHLRKHHDLQLDLAAWFTALRQLAEQSYENKSLTFGSIISTTDPTSPKGGAEFPIDFLERKRFRALSDGYRTAYRVSSKGAIVAFSDLPPRAPEGNRYYPKWCDDLAAHSRKRRLGLCLTRQGDLLVLDSGRLTFTYRFGRWQYWNHTHVVDLIANAARVQHVRPAQVSGVVRSIYRAALDVAFRRSGGLFVILRNKKNLRKLVRHGDAIGDRGRPKLDAAFDAVLDDLRVQTASRAVVAELAALDGAVVMANTGRILAYGAVLDPKRKGRVRAAEGSRTKAAIGASNYGLAVKISSDGDIVIYAAGKKLIAV